MSLASAILKYADELSRCESLVDGRNVAERLRIIVEAATDNAPAPQYVPSHREMIEKAKAEFRGKILPPDGEESDMTQVVQVLSGPNKGDMVPMRASTKPGSLVYDASGNRYEFRDGGLHVIE